MRKTSDEDFVNDLDYEDENVDDRGGGGVRGDNVAYMATIRNRTLSKICRVPVCLDDNQQ